MPELPEVEAVCRKLRRDAVGARITLARLIRRPDRRLAERLRGRRIAGVDRRGKNILLRLDSGLTLRVHLRMTGNLYVVPDVRFRPALARAVFELDGGGALVFEDPRALGVVELLGPAEADRFAESLGIEPLSDAFTPDWLAGAARRSRAPAKLFLMDQKRIAGLGNIYSAEALFRARIHPAKPMNRLSRKRLERLHQAIVGILDDAVQSACNAYTGPGKFEARETFPLAVYGREGERCPRCGRRIRRIPQHGRSTYFCPGCQR
jgi:formamidopyrimidine-DNA glycosylase